MRVDQEFARSAQGMNEALIEWAIDEHLASFSRQKRDDPSFVRPVASPAPTDATSNPMCDGSAKRFLGAAGE